MPVTLHIGMQKTGTSAIQYFLHSNPEALARDNIIYPDITKIDDVGDGIISYHNCLAARLIDVESAFSPMSDAGIDRLRRVLGATTERVIISAEDFSRAKDISPIWEFFRPYDPTVVIYLREQSDWAQSMYNQRNKILFANGNPRLFTENILTEEDLFKFLRQEKYAHLMRYDNTIDRWVKAFGRDRVVVRVYPSKSNLISDFMSDLGVRDIQAYNAVPRVNENLSNTWLRIARAVGGIIGTDRALAITKKLSSLSDDRQISLSGKTKFLPDEVVYKIQSEYAESNSKVATEFFNCEELFRT